MRTQSVVCKSLDSRQRVSEGTHSIYRYPARFSPEVARALIEHYTKPGELIVDPFVGSGTSIIEARTAGRRGVGTDLSSLAVFIAQTKIKGASKEDAWQIRRWAATVEPHKYSTEIHGTASHDPHYLRNISCVNTWRIREFFLRTLSQIPETFTSHQKAVTRLALLRTGQWAVDGRRTFPKPTQVREHFAKDIDKTLSELHKFRRLTKMSDANTPCNGRQRSLVVCTDAENISSYINQVSNTKAKLILTSPPYPGVHVLYHRWQLLGGKETAFPFLIAGELDGHGESYYTLGGRHAKGRSTYFDRIARIFGEVRKAAHQRATIAQLVAFSDLKQQLPKYLAAMEEAGYTEVSEQESGKLFRKIREVPNRKWHANLKGSVEASREVLLLHRITR